MLSTAPCTMPPHNTDSSYCPLPPLSLSPILFILAVLVTIAWQVGWNLAHLLNFCGNF